MSVRFTSYSCTRCGVSIGVDDEPAAQVLVSRYEPLDPGPGWEAAGDRAPPESLGAVLCAVCLALLRSWLYETQETS